MENPLYWAETKKEYAKNEITKTAVKEIKKNSF
jgi:hypothetical protein